MCVGGVSIPCVVRACRSHVCWGRVDPVCGGGVSIPCVVGKGVCSTYLETGVYALLVVFYMCMYVHAHVLVL